MNHFCVPFTDLLTTPTAPWHVKCLIHGLHLLTNHSRPHGPQQPCTPNTHFHFALGSDPSAACTPPPHAGKLSPGSLSLSCSHSSALHSCPGEQILHHQQIPALSPHRRHSNCACTYRARENWSVSTPVTPCLSPTAVEMESQEIF